MNIKDYLKGDLKAREDAINGLIKTDYASFGKIFLGFTAFFGLLLLGMRISSVDTNRLISNYLYIVGPFLIVMTLIISYVAILPKTASWSLKNKYFDSKTKKWIFTDTQIAEAADLLVKIKPATYDDLIDKNSPKAVDILIITKSIDTVSDPDKLQRIVSLKAIEKDEDAGEGEDE